MIHSGIATSVLSDHIYWPSTNFLIFIGLGSLLVRWYVSRVVQHVEANSKSNANRVGLDVSEFFPDLVIRKRQVLYFFLVAVVTFVCVDFFSKRNSHLDQSLVNLLVLILFSVMLSYAVLTFPHCSLAKLVIEPAKNPEEVR